MRLDKSGNGKISNLIKEVDLLISVGNQSKALSLIEQAIQAEPSDWYLYYLKGWIYQSDGNGSEALKWLLEAEELAPDDIQLKAIIGELLVAIGEIESALPYLESIVEAWPESSEAHSLHGIALVRSGNYEDAERTLQKSCKLSVYNPDARSGLIELYRHTSRSQLIRPQLEEYLHSAPELASAYCFMADYLAYQEGNCEGACSFYEKALACYQQSGNPGWFRQYLSTSNYPDTILDSYLDALLNCEYFDLLRAVSRDHHDPADSKFWESRIFQRQGKLEPAIDSILDALKIDPDNPAYRSKYAEFLLQSGESEAAEAEITTAMIQAAKLGLYEPWHEGVLVASLIAQGRRDEADKYLHKNNDSIRDRINASIIHNLFEIHHWSDVVTFCQKSIQDDADNSTAMHFLAKAYKNLNQLPTSIEIYRQLLEQQPENGLVQLELGLVYEQAGSIEEAILSIEHALKGNYLSKPHQDYARKVIKRLRTNS